MQTAPPEDLHFAFDPNTHSQEQNYLVHFLTPVLIDLTFYYNLVTREC